MPHSDNSYACLRDNNSVCIFFKRKQQQQHTHTHDSLVKPLCVGPEEIKHTLQLRVHFSVSSEKLCFFI